MLIMIVCFCCCALACSASHRGIRKKEIHNEKKIGITHHFLINSFFCWKKMLIVDLNAFHARRKKTVFADFAFHFIFCCATDFVIFFINFYFLSFIHFVVVHFQIEWFHLHRKDQRRLVIITRTHLEIAYSACFRFKIYIDIDIYLYIKY